MYHGKAARCRYNIVLASLSTIGGRNAAIGLLRYAQQSNGSILSQFVVSVTSGVEATRCGNVVVAEQSEAISDVTGRLHIKPGRHNTPMMAVV